MILINGKKTSLLEFSDRGFQYGDGLFETVEVINGQPVFLKLHLDRLAQGCKTLKIPFKSFDILEKEVKDLVHDQNHAVLKIILTRGSGGRGYQQPDPIIPTRVVSLHPFPEYPVLYKTEGIKLRFCSTRLGLNPNLRGIKHLNRLDQILARAEWQSADYQEGLMLDINNNVIEGTMSNLFIVNENHLFTPKLDLCGVRGIIRQLVFRAAQELGINLTEIHLTKQQCLEADEIFLTNSVISLWPASQLLQKTYTPGVITFKIQQWLNDYKDRDLCQAS